VGANINDAADAIAAGLGKAGIYRLAEHAPTLRPDEVSPPPFELAIAPNGGEHNPEPLPTSLTPVLPLTADMLPAQCRSWILDAAERMNAPLDSIAAAFIVGLGSLIGRRFGVCPKQFDDSWVEIPNLWGALIGPPASMKSPAIGIGLDPIERLARQANERFATELREFEIAQAADDAVAASSKREIQSLAIADGDRNEKRSKVRELIRREQECALKRPTLRRYKTQDATIEKLAELLQENPNGLLVTRDELSGFLATFDKPGRETDRSFFLEAWNGKGTYDVDRIARGHIHVKALCLSVFGGIQPGPVKEHIRRALEGGIQSDGFFQRLQILVYPDEIKEVRLIDRQANIAAETRVHRLFDRLEELTPAQLGIGDPGDGRVPVLHFSSDAQELFNTWLHSWESRLRQHDDPPALESHFTKYRKLVPSLALLFYLCEFAEFGTVATATINRDSTALAVRWAEYLESHARRVYALPESDETTAAEVLLAKLQSGKLSSPFTARQVERKKWSGLTLGETVKAAIRSLELHGWIVEEVEKTGGRDLVRYRAHETITAQPHAGGPAKSELAQLTNPTELRQATASGTYGGVTEDTVAGDGTVQCLPTCSSAAVTKLTSP
jgi:hypothetical protein